MPFCVQTPYYAVILLETCSHHASPYNNRLVYDDNSCPSHPRSPRRDGVTPLTKPPPTTPRIRRPCPRSSKVNVPRPRWHGPGRKRSGWRRNKECKKPRRMNTGGTMTKLIRTKLIVRYALFSSLVVFCLFSIDYQCNG